MAEPLNNTQPTGDDRIYVERAIDGDAEAFGVLYERHLDAIYRYIYFRVETEVVAEDLTEETFVRAWEALPGFKVGQHPFTSWLYRIAHNLVIDHRRKRSPLSLPEIEFDLETGSDDLPEQIVSQTEDISELRRAVQQLDEEAQQIILMRFVEGLSHREVARIIGKTEGATRVAQHRALDKLHKLLVREQHHG